MFSAPSRYEWRGKILVVVLKKTHFTQIVKYFFGAELSMKASVLVEIIDALLFERNF